MRRPGTGKKITDAQLIAAAEDSDDEAAGARASTAQDELSNVLYIGHLPHGFYEKQILGFFSQFGRVLRARVARSKRTARAKGYAYLEFAHAGVAEVAAGAMHGHLVLKQALSVRCLPRSEVHPETFRGAERAFRAVPWGKIEAARHNAPRTLAGHARRAAAAAARDARRRQKLAALGIDYEYDDVLGKAAAEARGLKGAAAGGDKKKEAAEAAEAAAKSAPAAAKKAPPKKEAAAPKEAAAAAAAPARKRRAAAAAEEPVPAVKKASRSKK